MVKAEYENGITMYISNGYPNGIRYEGNEGWIFVSRGSYVASSSDPVTQSKNAKALDASDPKILTSEIKENEIHLYQSDNQHGNWLDCIQSRKEPISPVEIGHRACTVCLIDVYKRQIRYEPWEIKPFRDYTLKYRMIVFDGKIDKQTAELYWNSFAKMPKIKNKSFTKDSIK